MAIGQLMYDLPTSMIYIYIIKCYPERVILDQTKIT